MAYNSTDGYLKILDELVDEYRLPLKMINLLMGYIKSIYRSDLENHYGSPMKWIGMYIAGASLVCILAMVADLLHGLRSRKLWFPCRYFRINAAFLSIITIAMKLPVDLSGSMPGNVDQAGKLGSMAFLCTMMANLLPYLASMDNNELKSNIIALGILVITVVVNVIIQINTGVVSYSEDARILMYIAPKYDVESLGERKHRNTIIACIYVAFLLVLLILHVCSCLAILKSKKIIDTEYQKCHVESSPGELLMAEKLEEHVINHWIMAESGSPQFITTCFRTTSASGVICVLVTILHSITISWTIDAIFDKDCKSNYSWSMMVILIVQSIGVLIGTIAPFFRCFATLSFKVDSKIISKHFKVFEVENYWTSKLYDWKLATMTLPFRIPRKREVFVETLKRPILRLCIEFQEEVVVVCKIISLVPFVFMICVYYCWKSVFRSSPRNFNLNHLRPYVLQLDDMELAERTLEGLSTSVNQLIRKGEERQHYNQNLIKLIEKSTDDFEGVKEFGHIDTCQVPSLRSTVVQYPDCWSLPVVILTIIAVSLREDEAEAENLLESVREGLVYVNNVEERLNVSNGYVSIRKEAESLWKKVYVDANCREWLGNKLKDASFKDKTGRQIVEWFRCKSKNIHESDGGKNDDPEHQSICANSMYHISKTILLTNIDQVSPQELFDRLSIMIADVIAACLTNIPQVITMKCHTSAIEKREKSVKDAALLLGETKEIVKTVYKDEHCETISGMNRSDLPFINKWRDHLRNP